MPASIHLIGQLLRAEARALIGLGKLTQSAGEIASELIASKASVPAYSPTAETHTASSSTPARASMSSDHVGQLSAETPPPPRA